MNQTLKPAQVILVDDASGDDTLSVLQQFVQKYPGWIKLLQSTENKGAASTRNAGWDAVSQPYVAFLDSDDAWHPRKIEIQYAYMSAHPEVILCGHRHRISKQIDGLPDWEVETWKVRHINKWVLLLSNRFVTPSVMVRRETNYRFVDRQRYMEDHMLWLLLAFSGGRVVKLSAELAAVYKSSFGIDGLSAQVWSMERGDLGNYRRLYRVGCINSSQLGMLALYSLLKYARRLVIYWGYLRWIK